MHSGRELGERCADDDDDDSDDVTRAHLVQDIGLAKTTYQRRLAEFFGARLCMTTNSGGAAL